jgi:alkylhydroperoxidase family enzyme
VPHGAALAEFAEAIEAHDNARLNGVRATLRRTLGPEGLVDAAAVAAIFNGLVRVADATGIPLEADKAEQTEDFRVRLGIGKYTEAPR